MTLKKKYFILSVILLAILGLALVWPRLPVSLPFFGSKTITDLPPSTANDTNLPLVLPPGFKISILAKDLTGARILRFDADGNLWVSRTGEGLVTKLEIKNGAVTQQTDILKNLRKPHGLAFDPDNPKILYVAEENGILKYDTTSRDTAKILDLPSGGGHFTRTIAFGPDKKLYIAVGSSCNVCRETDERRASILRYDPVTRKTEIHARGLRNAVFFAWSPFDGKMWATEMGRDWLGDNLPPDEINIVEDDKNYGWPICYGKNIHDTDFDKNVYIRNPCMEPFETSSHVDIPAHSAPLGLAFAPPSWPAEYRNNLLVAYHGSWNRSAATGYKVVRMKFAGNGNYVGVEDFITGWLTKEGALGRPVDILIAPDGVMYLSDDKADVVYRVEAPKQERN